MSLCCSCFFFNDPATTETYPYLHTLSLHDALPISDRHRLDPVRAHRLDRLAVRTVRPPRQTEHRRDAWAIDIRVQDPHPCTLRGQRKGQVDGGRRLADAPLPGTDGDDVAHPRQRAEVGLHGVGGDAWHCGCPWVRRSLGKSRWIQDVASAWQSR